MTMQTNVVNDNGTPAVCYLCGNPAATFINTSANAASSVPSNMRPVCDEHDPYKMRDVVMSRRHEWEAMQAVIVAAQKIERWNRDPFGHRLYTELATALDNLARAKGT
jgi:hypothetical protein